VWLTAQTTPAGQRRGRYVPESTAHPAKMLPAIAAHAIRHYTQPGDWRASQIPDTGPNKVRPGTEDDLCENGVENSRLSSRTRL
jgi:hypothetical protein